MLEVLEELGFWAGGDCYVPTVKQAYKHVASPSRYVLVRCGCGAIMPRPKSSVRSGRAKCCFHCSNSNHRRDHQRAKIPAEYLRKYNVLQPSTELSSTSVQQNRSII